MTARSGSGNEHLPVQSLRVRGEHRAVHSIVSELEPCYAFTGDARRVHRKMQALRRRFGPSEAIRLGSATGDEVVDACRALGFDPNRVVIADARAWKKADVSAVALYLLDPTPGTCLALQFDKVPKELPVRKFVLQTAAEPNLLWPMVDAWGANRRALAMELLARQLGMGDSPFGLLAVLASHVRFVLQVKSYAAQGLKADEVHFMTGKSVYVVRKAHEQGRRRTQAQLASYLAVLADADDRMKGGARTPVEFELTHAVARLF